MWGTGRTPAGLHVHTTRLCWTARLPGPQRALERAGWLNPLTSSDTLDREPQEPTMQAFWNKKGSLCGLGLRSSNL